MIDRIAWRLLRLSSSLRYLLASRFTRAGNMALAGLFLAAVFGLDTNFNQAYQLFTLLLALLLLSLIHSRMIRIGLYAERMMPLIGTAGEPLRYRIRIKNNGGGILTGLELLEQLPDVRPSFADFTAFAANGSRPSRYLRWQELCKKTKIASPHAFKLPQLYVGDTAELRIEMTPLRRGVLKLTGIKASRPDIFGLIKSSVPVQCQGSCLIIPKRYPLPPIPLPGNRAFQQGGVALAASVADSEEFQSLREYRPGDPMRMIHWKSWARSGKPVIREYQAEFFVRHALVLDTFDRESREEIFEEAVSVAASFACTVETRESLLDLMFVGADVYCETTGQGHGPVERLLEVLAGVSICSDKPFQVLNNLVTARCGAMSGCICVLLAWDEERRSFINRLNSLGVPSMVLVITDPSRTNLPALKGDETSGRFHILETGKIGEGLAGL